MTPARRARDDFDKNRLRISPAQFRKGVVALGARVLAPTDEHPYEHYLMTTDHGVVVVACDPSIKERT